MSPELPKDTLLGVLSYVEVHTFYDVPRLFVATNTDGQRYLAVWTDEDSDADRWLYVPVSQARFQAVQAGRVSLREAFGQPEDGFAFVVRTPFRGEDTATRIEARCIPEEDLPGEALRGEEKSR